MFGATEWWQFEHWFRYGGGLAMLRELYAQHGLYTIGMEWWGIESLPSKVPIRKLEDLKGLKMRNPGGINAPIFAKFGVSLIVLPGEEIYGALERGVINFTDWGTPSMNYKFGFHEVTKYFTWPGFHHMPNADFSVRMDEWKKLSDDLKATLEAATRDWAWDSLVRLGFEDIKAVEAMKAKGLEALKWDPAEVARLREIAITAWDEWATKNPMSARAIESQKDFMRKLGLLK